MQPLPASPCSAPITTTAPHPPAPGDECPLEEAQEEEEELGAGGHCGLRPLLSPLPPAFRSPDGDPGSSPGFATKPEIQQGWGALLLRRDRPPCLWPTQRWVTALAHPCASPTGFLHQVGPWASLWRREAPSSQNTSGSESTTPRSPPAQPRVGSEPASSQGRSCWPEHLPASLPPQGPWPPGGGGFVSVAAGWTVQPPARVACVGVGGSLRVRAGLRGCPSVTMSLPHPASRRGPAARGSLPATRLGCFVSDKELPVPRLHRPGGRPTGRLPGEPHLCARGRSRDRGVNKGPCAPSASKPNSPRGPATADQTRKRSGEQASPSPAPHPGAEEGARGVWACAPAP